MKRMILTLGILMLAVVVSACGRSSPISTQGQEVKVDGGSYWNITPAQLKAMLENKDFLLINVHIPYEGEIPETDLFVPYDEIEQNLSKFPENKGAKIVLYCRSGPMSATAAKTLVDLRFTNVRNLDGGMLEWERRAMNSSTDHNNWPSSTGIALSTWLGELGHSSQLVLETCASPFPRGLRILINSGVNIQSLRVLGIACSKQHWEDSHVLLA